MSRSAPSASDLLASFSPSSDFFAISAGDGRIKIWDTIKGQLQTEFSDLATSDSSSMLYEPKSGHLSLDYTCMKWILLERQKKRKPGSSLLVLGTGNGDVLALEVSAGQLKWKISQCHPGGVNAVSYSQIHRWVYTTGADGIVCQIDALTGSVVNRFRPFNKPVSSLAVSADGKILAAAASQFKTFSCSDNKKLQKFNGHPVAVRCMIFSEDGRYIMTSGVGERHVAIWKVGCGKKQSASSFLSMEHPAISLDSKNVKIDGKDGDGLSVLAISEMGVCYFWCGSSIEDLRKNPTRVSACVGSKTNFDLTVYAAKLLDIPNPASGQVFVAYGSLVKPSFQKLMVQSGIDIKLDDIKGGVLLPLGSFSTSRKGQSTDKKETVTAVDRANAEDAIFPIPKFFPQDKKRKHSVAKLTADIVNARADPISNKNKAAADKRAVLQRMEEDDSICIEDRLRQVGILTDKDHLKAESCPNSPTNSALNMYSGGKISVSANLSKNKIRAHISSMNSIDAYKFLEVLISSWKKSFILGSINDDPLQLAIRDAIREVSLPTAGVRERKFASKTLSLRMLRYPTSPHILPWIYYILVNHGEFVISQDSSARMLDNLHKMTRLKCATVEPLLKLSGRFRLIMAQIDKAGNISSSNENLGEGGKVVSDDGDEVDNEDDNEDEDIDEMVYGEDDSASDEEDQSQT